MYQANLQHNETTPRHDDAPAANNSLQHISDDTHYDLSPQSNVPATGLPCSLVHLAGWSPKVVNLFGKPFLQPLRRSVKNEGKLSVQSS